MIIVTFTPSEGSPFNGILLKRESGLCLIAFDQTMTRPLSVGWHKMGGQYRMKSKDGFVRWIHPAMKLIESGNVDGAMDLFRQEEKRRSDERLKKEKSI